MGYGKSMGYEGTLCGNRLGNSKNLWGMRGYGLSGVWVKRMTTVLLRKSMFGGDGIKAPRANLLPLTQYRRVGVLLWSYRD